MGSFRGGLFFKDVFLDIFACILIGQSNDRRHSGREERGRDWERCTRTLVFQQLKSGFESVISIFCCSVSVGNISLHFQTFILPLIVIKL